MSKFSFMLLINPRKYFFNHHLQLCTIFFEKGSPLVITGFPVRRKYPQSPSDRLIITSDETIDISDDSNGDGVIERQEEVSLCSKRLLPDRSQAAYNRANEKLVQFIVKQRKAEKHLLVWPHGRSSAFVTKEL